eukprot:5128478-Pyramimonas_sp.AAC.1
MYAAHVTLEGDLRAEGIQILNQAYRTWNELAWQELEQVTGTSPTGVHGGYPMEWEERRLPAALATKTRSFPQPPRAIGW